MLGAVFLSTACAAVDGPVMPLPAMDNRLADCVDLVPRSLRVEHGSLWLDADATVIQPIGACGCVSAMAGYHSLVLQGGRQILLHRGEVNLKSGGLKAFDLGAVGADGDARTLRLMCAGPR
ncbi:DUF2195 family protein [Denitromonas iodatirespirans]|uniref:DUF2195 family protein n=1 Tax=Denitromonas iodatirespirans TaxID=2795389 RepID=A0A944D9G4_DENI1|nr:DUF2195 family protein [Denitromonas iodatirespirans]MBT0960463.1 DUF2195 family protein [Denitromonas iodatirespirans]